jgi:hypothetical protein
VSNTVVVAERCGRVDNDVCAGESGAKLMTFVANVCSLNSRSSRFERFNVATLARQSDNIVSSI